MAKVMLTAFQNKLRSDLMDWPDSMLGKPIRLMLDIERNVYGMFSTREKYSPAYQVETKIGTFEDTGAGDVYKHPDGTTELVYIYTLTGIN